MKAKSGMRDSHVINPDTDNRIVIASLEIKTACTDNTIKDCQVLANEYGTFNTFYITEEFLQSSDCESFRALIATNHFCQCLHQAYTLNLNHVLYVKAHASGMIYSVFMHFDEKVLLKHEQILSGNRYID